MPESVAAKYLRGIIAKFPKAGARTIARIAYRESPTLWPNVTACLNMVRIKLGVAGKKHRKTVADKTQFREPRKTNWDEVIPEPIEEIPWVPFEVPGKAKTLVMNDAHIPFHAAAELQIAIAYGLDRKADKVILNGDTFDHYGISRWEKDPRKRDFPDEVKKGKKFLKGLRQTFPNAQIILKWGNHEERWDAHMRSQAPDLLGIEDFEWATVFRLKEYEIDLVKDKRPIMLGKLPILHGHEFVRGIGGPVSPARGMFLRAKTNCLVGHFHNTSNHSERTLEDKSISTWSVGCLCQMHPDYMRINNWNWGLAFVETEADGAFQVDNLKIINGRVW